MIARNYDNFVLVRLLMALLVMITHFKLLSGAHCLDGLPLLPDFAIAAFFVISGYVITASFDKLPNVRAFYAKRLFRMYPLYALVVLVQTVCMSLFFIHDLGPQLHSIARYFFANLFMLNFLQYDIGGLLSHARNPGINPSLWTLKIEIMFYAVVPLLHRFYCRFKLPGLVALYALSTGYTAYLIHAGHPELARQLPGATRYIVVGMALYFNRRRLAMPVWVAAMFTIAGLLILAFFTHSIPLTIYPLLVGPMVIIAATKFPLPRPKSDVSYGTYLYHAPLIQFALLTGLFVDSVWFLALLIGIACALGWLGYKFIEVPCVALGQRISKYAAMEAPKRAPAVVAGQP